jgi:hypothetical protein
MAAFTTVLRGMSNAQEKHLLSQPTMQRLLAALIAVVAFMLSSAASPSTGFNPDESRWLARAHYLTDLADPFGPTWADQYMTRGQPPLGSYAMGLALLLYGRDLETNPPWDFAQTWEENIAIGNKPVPADLNAGRNMSAIFTALTAVALIAVTRLYVSPPWALAAGALYALHPFSNYLGSLAMSDALFGLIIALAALAAASFARRPAWSRAALLGVLLGLGGATKLTPLAVAAFLCAGAGIALACAIVRHRRVTSQAQSFALFGTVTLLAALAVFVAVYPYLWPDPIARTRHLIAFRATEMATQASDWPEMAVSTRSEALRRAGINFVERYNLAATVASSLGASAPLLLRLIEVALALFGLALIARMAIRAGPYSPPALVLIVLGGQALITVLGMRSEFDRYHLPLALLGTVAAAVALEWLARNFMHYLRQVREGMMASRGQTCGS